MLTLSSSLQAKIYKCSTGDSVAYQAAPCRAGDTKTTAQTVIIPTKTTASDDTARQCDLPCETKAMTCRSQLTFGNYNSDGGLQVCALQETACKAECNNAENAAKLKSDYLKAKRKYQAALKKLANNQQTEALKQKKRQAQAQKDEDTRQQCIRQGILAVEKLYNADGSLDASQRRRYRNALENVKETC